MVWGLGKRDGRLMVTGGAAEQMREAEMRGFASP